MSAQYVEHYTAEDYRQWEGDWELIYGVAYAMAPSPMVTHQSVNGKILRQLDTALDRCAQCQALFEIDWEVTEDTVVRPDTLVICYEPDEHLTKKPELIFEIISPSTARRDETLKFDLYQQEGVAFYVIVYPHKQIAKLYRLHEGRYVKVDDFSDGHYLFELEGCTIDFDFSRIWRVR